jgi:hypothetical protein
MSFHTTKPPDRFHAVLMKKASNWMLMIMILINKSNHLCNLPQLIRLHTSLKTVANTRSAVASFFSADQLWDD